MRATMLLSATSNGVGVNVRLVGYDLSISRYQGIYNTLSKFITVRAHCRSDGTRRIAVEVRREETDHLGDQVRRKRTET